MRTVTEELLDVCQRVEPVIRGWADLVHEIEHPSPQVQEVIKGYIDLHCSLTNAINRAMKEEA